MKIGLIGKQRSGKTTIFNALTGRNIPLSSFGSQEMEANVAIVSVNDERVDRLTEMYKPKKSVRATFELFDFPGFTQKRGEADKKESLLFNAIRTMDGLGIVLGNFSDDADGTETVLKDLADIDVELLIPDMVLAENRLERLEASKKRGQQIPQLEREIELMTRIYATLADEKPLRTMSMNPNELALIRGYQFLTLKPRMVILNSDETRFGKNRDLMANLEASHETIECCGSFEMELTAFEDPEEASLFMEDIGITASVRDRLSRAAYATLGLISFFTVGEDEVRAWTIKMGDTAIDAARAIHSDLARGFIRAQCFSYNQLIEYGSEKKLREHGACSLQGKDYQVEDGTIMNILFSV